MSIESLILSIIAALQTLLIFLVKWAAKLLQEVRSEVQKINGRLGRMEQWRDDHQKEDDRHHLAISLETAALRQHLSHQQVEGDC